MINIYDRKCGNLTFDVAIEIFDKTIVPILTYGAEIWGCRFQKVIEKVHAKFVRKYLGVGPSASTTAIMGETGRRPIAIVYHIRCFKFWLKIKNMPDDRLPKRLYLMLRIQEANGRKNWISDFKDMLQKFGCEHFWRNQENILPDENEQYIQIFRNSVVKYYEDQWSLDLHNSSKLSVYATFKSTVAKEKYLVSLSLKKYIKVLAKFRTSNHELEIEIGRHKGLRLEERLCEFCKESGTYVIEDEYHLVLCCPLYADLRHCYSWLTNRNSSFEFFIEIMNDTNEEHIVQFATFLDKSFAKRKQFIDSKITN